jgi:hypothetical protein
LAKPWKIASQQLGIFRGFANNARYGKLATLYKERPVDRFQGIDTIGQHEKLGKITDLGQQEALGINEKAA